MEKLLNPRAYVVGTVKEADPRFAGGKVYFAKLGSAQPVLVGVVKHKRASEAEAEAKEWRDRLIAEYDAKIAAMLNGDEAAQVNAKVVEPAA